MIVKCVALLAVVAQISAAACNQQAVAVNCNSCSQNLPPLTVSNTCGKNVVGGSTGGVLTRNIVVKGKYPVALCNCGPTPDKQIPVTTSHVRAPVQEKPTVRLPANIPAPKVIGHSCTCYKTIIRPRVHQQIITVPSVQRYIETTHKPVVENIHYEACPVNCQEDSNCRYQAVEVPATGATSTCGAASTCGAVSTCGAAPTCGAVSTCGATSTCGTCGVSAVQVPTCGVQTVQVPTCGVQTVQVPSCGVPTCGSCGVSAVQVPTCGVQTVRVPSCGVQVVRGTTCDLPVSVGPSCGPSCQSPPAVPCRAACNQY